MKKFLCAFAFLLLAVPAMAQGTSCDKPALTGTIPITSPTYLFSVGVPAGQPAPAGFKVSVDGANFAAATDLGTLPAAGVSATGEVCFNAAVTVSNGNHTIVTYYYTLDGGGVKQPSPASTPFVLSLGAAVPTLAPINHPR